MGTKNNPSKFDCYAKAEPDEPMFVLLARDHFAPIVIDIWVHMIMMHNEAIGESGLNEKLIEATDLARQMKIWKDNKDKPKNEEDEIERLRQDSVNYEILLRTLDAWGKSEKTMPANEFSQWLLRNRQEKVESLLLSSGAPQEKLIQIDSNTQCICGHTLIEHNIFQDFSYQGTKMGPAQAPEYRHCKECKCPKFQKPNM